RTDGHFLCAAQPAQGATERGQERHHHNESEEEETEEEPPAKEDEGHAIAISALHRKGHAHGGDKRSEGSQRQPARVAREVKIIQRLLHVLADVKEVAI